MTTWGVLTDLIHLNQPPSEVGLAMPILSWDMVGVVNVLPVGSAKCFMVSLTTVRDLGSQQA